MRWRHRLIIAMLMFCISSVAADARVYRSPEFGMRIPVPAKLPFCSNAPDEMNDYGLGPYRPRDHGPDILLDPRDRGHCNDLDHRRAFETFVYYNAIDEERTLEGLLGFACSIWDDGAVGKCGDAPRPLGLKGWRTLTFRRDLKDGWIVVDVVAQTGTSPHDKQAEGVCYIFTLHTNAAHFHEDLATFRKFLANIRIWRTTTSDE